MENRLEETENALYRIMTAMDNESIIQKAFQDGVPGLAERGQSFRGEISSTSAPPASKTDVMIAHWESYPLQSASDLYRWGANVKSHTQSQTEHERATGYATDDPNHTSETTASTSSDRDTGTSQLTHSCTGYILGTQQASKQHLSTSVAASGSAQNQAPLTVASMQPETRTESATNSGLDLPAEFQKQFIW